ncbi:MAG: hypothetical protein ACYC7E_06920 [Armatimonadota bacterium]
MRSPVRSMIGIWRGLVGVLIALAVAAGLSTPGRSQVPQATPGKKPALLIIDNVCGHLGYWNPLVVQEMLDAGYEVGMYPRGKTPTMGELTRYNVALVVSTGADFAADLQPKLEQFMAQGGGVLVTPSGVIEHPLAGVAYMKWLKSLGATIYFHGVVDPERRKVLDWYKQPGNPEYSWTSEIADSPVTRGVKTLWYRTGVSAHYTLLSSPMDVDGAWTPLVFTGPGSRTVSWAESPYERDIMGADFRKTYAEFIQPQGRTQGRLPLVAVRLRGAGRLAVVSLNPQDLFWSAYIPARGGVMLHKGFGDRPSDGWQLLDNLYRWLAEPSLAGTALGGAKTDRSKLFREPSKTQPPFDWKLGAEAGLGAPLPGADPLRADAVTEAEKLAAGAGREAPRGLAGAHTAYSSGKGTVAEWATAAKAAGLDFIVFMEDWGRMNATKWEKLKADCAAVSDDKFLAYPGMEFQHENFNRGYMFNRRWQWMGEEQILTRDRRFIQTSRNVPSSECGPLHLWLAYDQPVNMGTQFTLGFFAHGTNLTPAWAHRGFGSMAVFTCDPRRVIDNFTDTLPVFLRLQNQKLVISPMALSLMWNPAEIAGAVKRGGPFVTLLCDKKSAASAIDTGGSYCYAGRASAICASTGPRILTWGCSPTAGYIFPRWNVAKREEDFFVLNNYRYRVRLAAESAVGLKEILIYDGDQGVYRRFMPNGRKQFEVTLDLSNDQSRHLVPVVKDLAGGIAIAPEIQTEHWALRHYLCSDRCNFGGGNAGQGAYYVHPGPYTTQQGPETMLMARWSRPVISADVLALRVNLDTRFETAGAYQYGFGNPWHAYYRTWPMEEMRIAKTEYRWAGVYGGPIYYLEEYWPGLLDSIWDFPMPDEPYYPENRWTPDSRTANLPKWKNIAHTASVVALTADVTLQQPWVSALHETKDYVPGQGAFDFRLGDRRLSGALPGNGAPAQTLTGDVPAGSLFALTGEPGKSGWCWLVSGTGLQYKLTAANGKVILDIGWPVPDGKAKKGTAWRWEVYSLSGPPTEAALGELLQPSSLRARLGTAVPRRFPYTYVATDGAVVLTAKDLRPIPCEWIPLEVRGLHQRQTAYWRELGTDKIRPIGIDPAGVGRAVLWRGKHDAEFFLGHPVRCSDPEVWFDAVRMADGSWLLDINNPTAVERTVTFSWHPGWPGRGPLPAAMKVPPGGRVQYSCTEVK